MGCLSSKSLSDLTFENCENFQHTFTECKCLKVYDGDTIFVGAKVSSKSFAKFKVRIYGIDTPEIRTKNLEEKAQGLEAKNFLENKILNKILQIEIRKETDKYGRLLASLKFKGEDIANLMIQNNYAKPYFGGTKEVFS